MATEKSTTHQQNPSRTSNDNGFADAVIDDSAEKLKRAARATQKQYDNLAHKATDKIHQVNGYVEENPLKSAMIAGGVGLVIGILIGRR